MKDIFLLSLIAFVLSGCCAPSSSLNSSTYQDDFNALEEVEVSDGINQSEAYTIAKAFFWRNISGCGFPEEPTSEGNFWVSKTRIGYSGVPGPDICVDKKTGTITWGDKTKTLEELRNSKAN